MHLKSLTLKGFKSFPDRTRLDFGPGVSVVVGPNGSGKSNVTDAVLWAMGEQSPLAVRGQSMQDVIFAGGRGSQARGAAEVEVVLDNSDGTVDLPLSEISILRRLDRSGDGGYLLNGARCRLSDVIEVLSDTGLGRENHSVISQGRVEQIVTSKPRERRLLIEEAAGLGKHRKRRRRAQLKLERTQENLDRALDIEREARTRLRPLKRQAEAAELHERLERQLLEARLELESDALRERRVELGGAEERVGAARERRAEVESRLEVVIERRRRAERSLTDRSERHDALAGRLYDARSARDRVGLRGEQVLTSSELLTRRCERLKTQIEALREAPSTTASETGEAPASKPARGPKTEGAGASAPAAAAADRTWAAVWEELREAIADGLERARAQADRSARETVVKELVAEVEGRARAAVALAVAQERADVEIAGERRPAERPAEQREQRAQRAERMTAQLSADLALVAIAERLGGALAQVGAAIEAGILVDVQGELERDSAAGSQVAAELRACGQEEVGIQTELRAAGEIVTEAEVAAQRLRDQVAEAEESLREIAERLGPASAEAPSAGHPQAERGPLAEEEVLSLQARVQRLTRRREQLGPVNPLAQEEYTQALEYVEELEARRADLDTALRELRAVIRDTDKQIKETFEQTFEAAARGFEELAGDLFPGGSGRLRLVSEEQAPRSVLGGQALPAGEPEGGEADAPEPEEGEEADERAEEELMGVEIEITPSGKSTKRLSLLSGGEKSMTALAFLFAVFLARPCPFYILDEVEAALDDLNLDRFLALLGRYSDRAQFIVITHQKRTMEAADWLYGVSMADDGVSKVVSRRLPGEPAQAAQARELTDVTSAEVAEVA
jgi:chromosome segregation ATPase